MKNPVPYLHRIAVALPDNRYTREQSVEFLLRMHGGDERTGRFIRKVADASAIDTRYSVLPDYGKEPASYSFFANTPTFRPEPGTKTRNDIFIRESERLAVQAAGNLFSALPGLSPGSITHLVTASCTGFGAPGFDLRLVKELGLSPSVDRFHMGFMGCLAAFPVMKLARELCIASPGARVLAVNVELCTLHFQLSAEPDALVANSLFADGASAALISARPDDSPPPRIRLERFVSRYIENTESDMAWVLGDTGFLMKLSRYVPQYIEANLTPILSDLIRLTGSHRESIRNWAIHPGGRAILEKAGLALGLTPGDLEDSGTVLRDYGNMSSATIMFVLKRFLDGRKRGPLFLAAFGPGLTVEAGLGTIEG